MIGKRKKQCDADPFGCFPDPFGLIFLLLVLAACFAGTTHACEMAQPPGKFDCNMDLPFLLKEAGRGDKEAQFRLGQMYSKGTGAPKNETEAVKWYRKAAEQNQLDAMHNLAKLYSAGQGVPKNEVEAFRLENKAAEKGHVYAQNGLGLHYLEGRGVSHDSKEAIKWLKKAADQGLSDAQSNLGKLYLVGDSVRIDYAEAFRWYQKAAVTGGAEAQFNLCSMYRNGQGVKKNMQTAYQWCCKSADNGNLQAQVAAGIFAYGTFPEITPDHKKAIYWWSQAANKGYADAQFLLGMAYDSGKAVPKNPVEARRWYELAAKQGNPQAISRLSRKNNH